MDKTRQWTFTAEILNQGKDEKQLFHLSEKGRWVVLASLEKDHLIVLVRTYAKDEPLRLETNLDRKKAGDEPIKTELIWLGYRLELRIDGKLIEEEWPIGDSFLEEDPKIICADSVISCAWTRQAAVREFQPRKIEEILFWAPDLGNENVGDCMPFADGDTYHLFYLKDRHCHRSKWGKGAHQFAHISTKDLVHWQEHPMAVEITHPWEGSICTGSVIKAKGRYYAFYAVRMMDETSAQLSWAVSDDCVHFTKSEKYFTLKAPYETTSARDPEVFYGADGRYHMLVTTNLAESTIPKRSGCLAHLVSSDLENWEQKEPFLVPGYTDQPECSDYFEWNGWYYLVFSNYGLAKYRYSREPFGPWNCPENELIDGPRYRVPKTADFHGRRIAAGFLQGEMGKDSYAGSLVLRELIQNADGTLAVRQVKELLPKADRTEKAELESSCENAYQQTEFLAGGWYLNCKILPQDCRSYGLLLQTAKKSYEIRIDSALRRVGVYPAHSALCRPAEYQLENVEGLKDCCTIDAVWKKGILDICINKARTLVCRLETEEEAADAKWGCFVKDGRAVFEAAGNR